MKKILLLFFVLLFFCRVEAAIEESCGTSGSISSNSIPTSGTIKVLVVFAQFKDDSHSANNGWALNTYPSWANDFISSNGSGPFAYNNLSQYFNEMSQGLYKVEGDVYNSLIITNLNESQYASIGAVNYEVLTRIDPYVNFALYDNLNGSSFGTDGKVDFIYIIYRNANSSNWTYTGIARLNLSQTINADGVQIVNGGFIGSGVQQRGGFNGLDYTLYVSAHEMGHYLFGSGHIPGGISNLSVMPGGPAWDASRGMHSWEKNRLGWLSYQDKSSTDTMIISDYLTTGDVYRIPVSASEYFLIENRQKISSHDWAGDNGVYIYHVTNATVFPPSIDLECADGNWNFSPNTSNHTLARTTVNVNGYDEMNFSQNLSGFTYKCYYPVYYEDAMWGDNEDAFDLTFNNVFSPVSNPRSTNSQSFNFAIEMISKDQNNNYTCSLYVSSPYAGKPSKPMGLKVQKGPSPDFLTKVFWEANSEPDLSLYEVWRKVTGSNCSQHDWQLLGTTTNNFYIDSDYFFSGSCSLLYKVRIKDTQTQYSLFSEVVSGSGNLAPKISAGEEKLPPSNYSLLLNYPNPFNPTTQISYSLKEDGFVTLKIYDVLGNEVATLVNEPKAQGNYSINFDASLLTSGVYIYTIKANDFTASKKMILTK